MNTLSTRKIIFLVALFSATLIGLLFFSHLRKAPIHTTLSNDAGTIFPLARDIQSFHLMAMDQTPFTRDRFLNHFTLLFFGFTHCGNICPTTLDLLNRVYTKLQPDYPNLQVVFISLDPDRDTPKTLTKYTQSFNKNFIGVTGQLQDIRKLQSQLGIFAARDDSSMMSHNYQLQHTSSILLINPKGQWAGLFKYGMNPTQFVSAFEESAQSLSQSG